MTIKTLPLGDQKFSDIIDDDLLYADKTKYIYDLIKSKKKNFFLSRPRRFGKTLLLRTLKELFTGDRGRFEDLWIGRSDYAFPKRPVIFLSMAQDSDSPEILKSGILFKLRTIAKDANLAVEGESLGTYFASLVQALHKSAESEVAVLIDEYDAPVTRNMRDVALAQANADVLHIFFATLKNDDVSSFIHFTLVTGITRYALTSMDSRPNHLNDISLKADYAGICGFTLEEFGPLFEDRMDATLAGLKVAGKIDPSADISDLRARIFKWYDGYNWGGPTRVLNPFSILHFFDGNSFDDYWIASGRPDHLTAMIRARPMDFLLPKLDSYTSAAVRKSDLTQLQPVPVLFHSGYLTLDKITLSPVNVPETGETEPIDSYSFRLPNFEVSSSYHRDCFKAVFGLESIDDLNAKGVRLRQAILSRDAGTVVEVLSGLISKISYLQRPDKEKDFHAIVQAALMAMGFKVRSEQPGFIGRLDLLLELPDKVRAITELKYCPSGKKPTKDEEDNLLANWAISGLAPELKALALAEAVKAKLPFEDINRIFSDAAVDLMDNSRQDAALASAALAVLTADEMKKALTAAARASLTDEETKNILLKAASRAAVPAERIDDLLSKAARKALSDMTGRGYRGIVEGDAERIIDLGLAIYGGDGRVKAIFG
jgi:hypothetical protein